MVDESTLQRHMQSDNRADDTTAQQSDRRASAPRSRLPQRSFVSIEYPAVLTERAYPSETYDDHPTLIKALESLSPLPTGYASAQSALTYLGNVAGQSKNRGIECKLSSATDERRKGNETTVRPRTANDIFRHALVGQMVDTHNIVCQVRRRTWTRRRADGTTEVRKEYTVDALGITRHVARFRTLPDFAFDPGSMIDPRSTNNRREESPSFVLHDALRQMDLHALRAFRLPDEGGEVYEVDDGRGGTKSNLRMPPPPLFDVSDTPFMYGFRQNPSSALKPFGLADAEGRQQLRYVNRQKYRELAPLSFQLEKASVNKQVPSVPSEAVRAYEKHHPFLLLKLREQFAKRPMWSRKALFNQFKGEERRVLQNQRYLIASVCYTITDGCWRDNLVLLGYDPRRDVKARFLQRIAFQRQSVRPTHQSATAAKQQQTDDADEEHTSEQSDRGDQTFGDMEDDRSHIFDGVTPRLTSGNYLLDDITDEYARSLIEAEGPGVLRETFDRTSGWYTQEHWAKLRSLLELRINALRQTGKPAPEDACMKIINGDGTKN